MKSPALALLACAIAAQAAQTAQAGSLRFCDRQTEPSADEQDTLLRFGAIVKAQLEQSGQGLALVSRSGLDLRRIGQRYSHAGLSLKASPNTPWSIRQLYYACDERRPRLYDQGMAGFVLGANDAALGYVSIVLLPGEAGAALEQVALSARQSMQVLGASYSANAYPFSLKYQNCNQWLAELLALAWGGLPDDAPRAQAQQWLRDRRYEPTTVDVGGWMWLGAFIPWIHGDDHPAEDKAAGFYRVSMPESLERFVHSAVPGATRIELCHAGGRVVIHQGWEPIAEGCTPGEGDEVITLDSDKT